MNVLQLTTIPREYTTTIPTVFTLVEETSNPGGKWTLVVPILSTKSRFGQEHIVSVCVCACVRVFECVCVCVCVCACACACV